MATTTLEQSVGQIVTEYPMAVSVFLSYGIDFYCRGDTPLAEALKDTDISVDEIIDEIEKAEIAEGEKYAKKRQIDTKNLNELVDYIENTYHKYLKRWLPEISQYLKVVRTVHGNHHQELYEIYDNFIRLKEELTDHLKKEEDQIFPLIKEIEEKKSLDNKEIALVLKEIEDRHEKTRDLLMLNKMLSKSWEIPDGVCTSYAYVYKLLADLEANTAEHIHVENNLLHSKVRDKLS